MGLSQRMDKRDVEVFSSNIKDFTEREQIYGEALRIEFEGKSGSKVSVLEHGVDNSGELIKGKLKNNNVDKLYVINGKEMLIEIKTAPEYLKDFFTFKVCSLKNTLNQGGRMVVCKLGDYHIFGTDALRQLLSLKHQIYEKFSPNDLAVRVYASRLDEMKNSGVVLHDHWSSKANSFLNQNKNVLLREKRT